MSYFKRALIVAALLVAAALGAAAQDKIFAFHGAFQDTTISPGPCGDEGPIGAVSMTVYDGNAWLVYTCKYDQVVLRRYFNPNDNVKQPIPVIVMQQIPVPATMPVCPVGMVNTIGDGQGCVTPSHPLARR